MTHINNMSIISKYQKNQLSAVNILLKELIKRGFENTAIHAAIFAIISKESNFSIFEEICYNNTSNSRIRTIFERTRNLNEEQLNNLKKNCVQFFNFVYGGIYGNDLLNDGFNFRGRGFNQITFKSNYEKIGKQINVDLVKNPNLLKNYDIAAKALVQYFINSINVGNKTKIFKIRYNVDDVYKIDDPILAAKVFFNINAGLGNDTRDNYWKKNTGYITMMSRLNDFNFYAINQKKKSEYNLASPLYLFLISIGLFYKKLFLS